MAVFDNFFLSYVVLVATGAVLFYAAFTDLRNFTISNNLIVALILLFVLYTAISGRWFELPWTIGFVALIFLVLLWFYTKGWMGGGDVKLLAVALLWAGIHCALAFAILLVIFSSLHTAAITLMGRRRRHVRSDGRPRIAFAPSVAAALIGIFMLGCVQPIR